MIQRFLRVATDDRALLEIAPAVFQILWGGWLLAPWDTYSAAPALWRPVSMFLEEWQLALPFLALGGFRVYCVVFNRISGHMIAVGLSAVLWVFVAVLFGYGTITGLSMPVYLFQAGIHVLLLYQLTARWLLRRLEDGRRG